MKNLYKALEFLFIGIALLFTVFIPGFFLYGDAYQSQEALFQSVFTNALLLIIAATLLAIYFNRKSK